MTSSPWLTEPNHIEFEHSGYPCIIHRVCFEETEPNVGHLCGYVGLANNHIFHGKNTEELEGLDVHGGITYAQPCKGAVCHDPKPGENEDLWWIGFDCAHYGDYVPRTSTPSTGQAERDLFTQQFNFFMDFTGQQQFKSATPSSGTYRTVSFVKKEICKLVEQLEMRRH